MAVINNSHTLTGANVTCRNQNDYMKLIRERLDTTNLRNFRESCFGQFIDVDTNHSQGQLIYLMYKHLDLKSIERRRISFIINGKHLELGPVEYFLITGLRFCGWEKPPSCSKIHNKIFGGKQKLFVADIYKAFDHHSLLKKGKGETVLKLALLLVLYGTLLVRHCTSKRIEVQYLHLVEDLEKFNKFPWGLVSYELLVTASYNTKLHIDERLSVEKKPTFDVFGFTFALQVFAYEVHRDLALHCAEAVEGASKAFPRFLRWTTKTYIHFNAILQYFEMANATSVEMFLHTSEEMAMLASNQIFNDMVSPVVVEKLLQYSKVSKAENVKQKKRKHSLGGTQLAKKQKQKEHAKVDDVPCSDSPAAKHWSPQTFTPGYSTSIYEEPTMDEATSEPVLKLLNAVLDPVLKHLNEVLDKYTSLQNVVSEIQSDVESLKNGAKMSVAHLTHEDRSDKSMVDPSIGLQCNVYRDEYDHYTRPSYDLYATINLQTVMFKDLRLQPQREKQPTWSQSSGDCSLQVSVKHKPSGDLPNASTLSVKSEPVARNPGSSAQAVVVGGNRPYPLKTVSFRAAEQFGLWYSANVTKGIHSDTVRIPRDPSARATSFTRLWTTNGLLDTLIIDSLVDVVLINAAESPHKFTKKWTVLDQKGWQALCDEKIETSSSRVLEYLHGRLPNERCIAWEYVEKVYGIGHLLSDHWVCYEVVFKKQEIMVYDSLSTEDGSADSVEEVFKHVATNIPWLLSKAEIWGFVGDGSKLKITWPVLIHQHPPQQPNGHDCGVMAIKFLQCLVTGTPVSILRTPNDNDEDLKRKLYVFRKSLCVELKFAGPKAIDVTMARKLSNRKLRD